MMAWDQSEIRSLKLRNMVIKLTMRLKRSGLIRLLKEKSLKLRKERPIKTIMKKNGK